MVRASWQAVVLIVVPALVFAQSQPSVEDAQAFVEQAEAELEAVWEHSSRAAWGQANFITEDTEILAARANERATALTVRLANEAARFNDVDLPDELERKLLLLRLALTVPAPSDPEETSELSRIQARMESTYGRGEYCPDLGECWDLQEMTRMLVESRDPTLLLDVWKGWRTVSPAMLAERAYNS